MKLELIDDLPILRSQLEEMDLVRLLDEYFPDHGHWSGISGGKMALGWLLYILSEGDHRLSHVEQWAEHRLNVLSVLLDESNLRSLDFSDDRLGRYLDRLSEDIPWQNFERGLGQRMIEVYKLSCNGVLTTIHTDSFNAPQYREEGQYIRHGYSKQRRSDIPFYKVMASVCGDGAIPLGVDIVRGSGTDANHYLPLINRLQEMFDQSGQLYVGDSQLGSMANRALIHQSGDYYLCPLNRKQVLESELSHYLDGISGNYRALPNLFTGADEHRSPVYFYELNKELVYDFKDDQKANVNWKERRILVYAPEYAKGLCQSFSNRLDEAEEKIRNLVIVKRGRKRYRVLADLNARIGAILKKYKVEGCFTIDTWEEKEIKQVQRYKNRAAEQREKVKLQLKISRKESYIVDHMSKLGWQIYGTNIPSNQMETKALVLAYRNEYKIEHLFDYMINRDTGLLPLYLKKEHRVRALIRLLMVGMRVSMVLQRKVRTAISKRKKPLQGIYPGNRGRKTMSPTTPMLLRAFKNIGAVFLSRDRAEMNDLSEVQREILGLIGAESIYVELLEKLKTRIRLRET